MSGRYFRSRRRPTRALSRSRPLVGRGRCRELLSPHGLFRIEDRFERLPLDRDRLDRAAGLRKRVGCDRCYCGAAVARFGLETLRVSRPSASCTPAARAPVRGRASSRARAHRASAAPPRAASLEAGYPPCSALRRGLAPVRPAAPRRGRPPSAAHRPLRQRIFLDHEPDLFEPALDLLLGADQSRQCRIASSIRG